MPTSDGKIKKLEALLAVGRRLSSEMDLDRLLALIMDEAARAMDAERGTLFLVDRERRELWSKVAQATTEIRMPLDKGIAGSVAQSGECINIPDAYADPRFNQEVDRRTGYHTRSILCVPMKNPQGETIGVIQVLNRIDGVFDADDAEVLLALASQAAVAVENARYHSSALRQERMNKDLEFARTIQQSFLPAGPPLVPGWEFAARYRPAQEVGGDFYDFLPLPDGRLGVLIGDVSGKGVPAALFMARLMSDFRFYATSLSSPCEVVSRINTLVADRSLRGMFVSLCYVQLEPATGKLSIANAGHLPPLLRSRSGRIRALHCGCNAPVGITGGAQFEETRFELKPGETVLLLTDGFPEAMNVKGALFGMPRVEKTLAEAGTAEQCADVLLRRVKLFAGRAPQHDDLTMICLQRGRAARAARRGVTKAFSPRAVHLEIRSEPAYLALVRRNLEFLLADDELLDQELGRIILAVDEAAANVIRYAYGGKPGLPIEFDFLVDAEWLTIKIRDYGKKPDLASIKPRPLAEIRPGGLGTRFMAEVMDRVKYDLSGDAGTLLTMRKRRSRGKGKN